MDAQVVDRLIDVLIQEAKVYEQLLEMSKNKTDVIVKGKVNELESMVKLEQTLVLKLGKLEGVREAAVEELSASLGVKPEDLNVTQLVKHLKDEQAERLKASQSGIVNTVNELKDANELNGKLIKSSLEYIDFSVNLLTNTTPGSNNYGSAGEVNQSKKRSLFDVKL